MSRQQQQSQQQQFQQSVGPQQKGLIQEFEFVKRSQGKQGKRGEQGQYIMVNTDQQVQQGQRIQNITSQQSRQARQNQQQQISNILSTYQIPLQIPQQSKPPTGYFARAKAAAMNVIGIPSQQQVKAKQYMKKGKQALAKLSQADKSKIDKAISIFKKLKPKMPELSEEQMIRLQMFLAPKLDRAGIIQLTDEDKALLKLAPLYLSVKGAASKVANKVADVASFARGVTAAAGFRRGGAPSKRKTKSKPKRKTFPNKKTKSKSKPKKKTAY